MTLQRLLSWILALGLVAAGFVAVTRAVALSGNQGVAVALSLSAVRSSSVTQAYPFNEILSAYQSAGVTTLVLGGTTLQGLVETGGTGFPSNYPVLVSVDDAAATSAVTVTVRGNPALADWIQARLAARLGAEQVGVTSAGPDVRRLTVRGGTREQLLSLNLGVHPADLALAKRLGLRVAVHYSEQGKIGGAAVLFAELPPGTAVLWTGTDLPDGVRALMQSRGDVLLIDHSKPPFSEGMPRAISALAAGLDYRAVKVFRVTFSDTLDDVWTAVRERTARLVLLQPFHMTDDLGRDLSTQTLRWGQMVQGLRDTGFQVGPAKPFPPYHPPLWALVLSGLGVGAAGALILTGFPGWLRVMVVLGGGAAAGMGSTLALQGTALAAAVLLPVLGAVRAAAVERLWVRLGWLAGAGFAGGVLLTALLGDIRFVLELALFRGIKVALVAPALVAMAALGWQPRQLLRGPVRVWHVAVALALAVGLALMLARSGQDSSVLLVSSLELKVRTVLERVLVARPRFKEFLFGWPLLVAAHLVLRRGARTAGYALVAVGLIAPASLINAFAHLHTPFWLSALRGVHGLWIGTMLGAVVLLALRRKEAGHV